MSILKHKLFASLSETERKRLLKLSINTRKTPRILKVWENNKRLLEEVLEEADGEPITVYEAYLWARTIIGVRLFGFSINDFVNLCGVQVTESTNVLDGFISFKERKYDE